MSDLVDDFKAAFRLYPAGVAILVATSDDGPVGMTASSVASVSAEPPLLSFSVAKRASSARVLTSSEVLRVVLLGVHQTALARAFATPGAPRFTPEQGWVADPAGVPDLPDAPVRLLAGVRRVVPAGESWLVLAQVERVAFGEAAPALLYVDRAYRSVEAPLRLTDGRAAS